MASRCCLPQGAEKPQELLKALIAFGGNNVSQEDICDALWPDAEGDAGYSSFKITLHQLRKLLNDETCIQVRDGRVSFDHQICYTDVRAFQCCAEQVKTLLKQRENVWNEHLKRLFTQVTELYHGDFLCDDHRHPWIAVARERLKGTFLRLMDTLYIRHEETGQWKEAALLCERVLETNEYDEDIYRRLMLCQLKLGLLSIRIITGRLGEITVIGNRSYSADFIAGHLEKLWDSVALAENALMRQLLILNEQPSLAVRSALKAGTAVGTTEIQLVVQDKALFSVT